MPQPPKKPRRTAERILDAALGLLNRFGEPNVSTTLIAADLGISPGNLYYHYPSKEALINALIARFERAIDERLADAAGADGITAAARFFEGLFDCAWQYRFLYRDLNDLLSKNRTLEAAFGQVLVRERAAVDLVIARLRATRVLQVDAADAPALAEGVVLLLTHALNHAYVRDPRHALEPDFAEGSIARSVYHVLHLLTPYLSDDERRLVRERAPAAAAAVPNA